MGTKMPAVRKKSEFFDTPPPVKRQLKLLLAGGANSGKTYTAIKLAKLIGGTWACLEADGRRLELYRGRAWTPDWLKVKYLDDDYSTAYYVQAVEEAQKHFAGLIIDGITPNWTRRGGILEVVSRLDEQDNKIFSGWTAKGGGNELYDDLTSSFWRCSVPLIVTIQAEDKYKIEKVMDKSGKEKPEVVKMEDSLLHRKTIGYPFDFVLLMDSDHCGTFLKPHGECWPEAFSALHKRPGKTVLDMMLSQL